MTLLLVLLAATPIKVYVDPGHGYRNNRGNWSSACEFEEDFALRTADKLTAALTATGCFEVKQSRTKGQRRTYDARIAEAEAWGADAMIGLHSDTRGSGYVWFGPKGQECHRVDPDIQERTKGFSILYSDKDPTLLEPRQSLARALARAMFAEHFTPYDGWDYVGLYLNDPTKGVFIDRRNVYMLRKPKLAAVIIETHHALDTYERAEWEKDETHAAFAKAVTQALLTVTPGGRVTSCRQ
jgi:N-acetylmuramoyl-L-alanine amidase